MLAWKTRSRYVSLAAVLRVQGQLPAFRLACTASCPCALRTCRRNFGVGSPVIFHANTRLSHLFAKLICVSLRVAIFQQIFEWTVRGRLGGLYGGQVVAQRMVGGLYLTAEFACGVEMAALSGDDDLLEPV